MFKELLLLTQTVDGGSAFSFDSELRPLAGRTGFLLMKPPGTRPDLAAPPQIIVVQNWFEELQRPVPTE